MSNQENLLSTTSRNDEAGGERSSAIKEKVTAVCAREVDDMIDLTRIEKIELNKVDQESMIDKSGKWCSRKKMLKSKNVHTIPESEGFFCGKQQHRLWI